MDLWKFFAIGHEPHVFCNPLSEEKFDEVIELLALPEGGRMLDIACGKAEFLLRTARRWKSEGVGVDISPFAVADARSRIAESGLSGRLEIVEGSGSDYAGEPGSFDVAACIGASWIWGGFEPTLRALSAWAKPGAWVIAGEPFWLRDPSPEHLDAAGHTQASWGTHEANVETALGLGLSFLHAVVSSPDDWDRYEGYQWYAAERYARQHPDDADIPELLERMHAARDHYLQWGRNEIGWALYLFATEPARGRAA